MISKIIGIENTLTLGKEFEGLQCYFPKFNTHINPENPPSMFRILTEIIGRENTLKLSKEFGGEFIYFPKFNSHMSPHLKERDQRIIDDFKKHNVNYLAQKYGVTQNRIYQIVRKWRKKR